MGLLPKKRRLMLHQPSFFCVSLMWVCNGAVSLSIQIIENVLIRCIMISCVAMNTWVGTVQTFL